MPNHIHGIIIIDKNAGGGDDDGNIGDVFDDHGFDEVCDDDICAAASRKWKSGTLGASSINTNAWCPFMRAKQIPISHGNHVFTIIS